VLDAARRLFLERGYVATTIDAIAERAAVSPETVYSAFGNKPVNANCCGSSWGPTS
jgi:AcrR family transcriptional regulator